MTIFQSVAGFLEVGPHGIWFSENPDKHKIRCHGAPRLVINPVLTGKLSWKSESDFKFFALVCQMFFLYRSQVSDTGHGSRQLVLICRSQRLLLSFYGNSQGKVVKCFKL